MVRNMWEVVMMEKSGLYRTERLKVHGGWLVRISKFGWNMWNVVTMTFVPDPRHQWETKK